jgi:hypothetical protein
MESATQTAHACAVAAAAAHDFNNELTVIMSGVSDVLDSLGPDHPARGMLLEIRAAAQRCVWKTYGLLSYSSRLQSAPVRASLEYLLDSFTKS